MIRLFVPFLLAALVSSGCSDARSGSYKARLEFIEGYKERPDQTSHAQLEANLAEAPRVLNLGGNGKFNISVHEKPRWEGTWRSSPTSVFLKASRIKTTELPLSVQEEVEFKVRGEEIVDDRSKKDGYVFVFSRQ